MLNSMLKTFGATILAVSLVGCGGVKTIKQEAGDSDAKQLMKIAGVKNHTNYLVDGNSPETAKIGVPESMIESFNGSNGRHIANYLAGGLSGVVSLGIIQSKSNSDYMHDYNILNYPSFIVISSNYKDYDNALLGLYAKYNDSYKKMGKNKQVILDKIEKRYYIDGESCSYEKRNCIIVNESFYGNDYDLISFSSSFKPDFKGDKYSVSVFNFKVFENYNKESNSGNLINSAENMKLIIESYSQNNFNDSATVFVYLPSAYNNGVPVIIDESGKEHYFVKK